MRNLSQAKILSAPIALAPLAEQRQVARHLRDAMAHVEAVEAILAEAKSRLEDLEQSLLVKAFLGDLVPQEPCDEPASVLLERIRAEPSTAENQKVARASFGTWAAPLGLLLALLEVQAPSPAAQAVGGQGGA